MQWTGRLTCALALLIGAGSCSVPEGDYFGKVREPDPKHFIWCNSGEPEYVDPVLSTSTTDMKPLYALFDGITVYGQDGYPRKSLALDWVISPDQKTFTFHLRRDARWSNGRPLTAHDFTYHMARLLHPITGSANAETLWKLRNGELYNAGKAKLVLRDSGPFRAGEVVELIKPKDAKGKEQDVPDSNLRRARAALPLRDAGDASLAPYGKVARGGEVTIIEVDDWRAPAWAYVHWGDGNDGDGIYGWVPAGDLEELHGGAGYTVAAVDDPPATRRQAVVPGHDLLMLPEVLGAEAQDDWTLVVRTATPTPYLIDMTPQRAFRPSPREAVSRSPKKWFRPENIVTSGEFHLEFWRQRDKFELVKSQTFWGKGDVKLDRVTILSMNDQSANANLYYQGGCDALVSNNVPSSYFPVLNGETGRGRPREDYIRSKFLGIYFYLVNVQKYPNPHFRRALSHALDRSLLPLLLKGGQIPTEQFMPGTPIAELTDDELALCNQFMDALRARTGRADLPPLTRESPGVATIVVKGEICYVPPMGPRYDLALAKRELELARQELGDKLPRRLTVKFNTGVEAHKSIAEWIQNQWEHNLGLNVSLESQEWKTFLKATRNQEYDVARMGSIGNFPDPEGEFLSQFKCASPDNRTAWCEPEFERLFKEAEATADRLQRMVLTWQAEDLVAQAAPTLPLYVYTQHNLQKPYVRGLAINFVDQQSLRDVWIDPDWKTSGKPKETPAP